MGSACFSNMGTSQQQLKMETNKYLYPRNCLAENKVTWIQILSLYALPPLLGG